MQRPAHACGKVWFIGAGPGDPELLTLKGHRLIAEADLVVYAGSLVPAAVVEHARAGAVVADSARLTLEQTHALMRDAALAGGLVARVHTGDGSIYGAVREQAALLAADGVDYDIVPGVSAAFAAAAAAKVGFTVPEKVQSFVIARLHGRTPVPKGQRVRDFARHNTSMAVYLSAASPGELARELRLGGLPEDTPVVIASRVGWPEQDILRATLATLEATTTQAGITRQAVFLVLPGERQASAPASRLYAAAFSHGYRKGDADPGADEPAAHSRDQRSIDRC